MVSFFLIILCISSCIYYISSNLLNRCIQFMVIMLYLDIMVVIDVLYVLSYVIYNSDYI